MRTILVIGSIEDEDKKESLEQLGNSLGRAIIESDHVLLNGGTDFPLHVDMYAANGAKAVCDNQGYEVNDRIRAVVRKGASPHGIGKIFRATGDVESEKRMSLIQKADVIIVIGGSLGTKEYLVLTELTKKPIIPIPVLGGVAQEYWNKYSRALPGYLPDFLEPDDFEDLNQVLLSEDTISAVTDAAIGLAKKSFSESNYVFVAMPLKKQYNNTLRAIEKAIDKVNDELDEVQYVCERIDKAKEVIKIDDEIEGRIKKAKIIIADLSESNANVYYELGFARGQEIIAVPIAERGTELPFDIRQLRTEFYDFTTSDIEALEASIEGFAKVLKDRIKAVGKTVDAV